MKTYVPSANAIEKKWYVVDATDKTLGRLASEVATVLRGKNKPIYTPFLDCGDYVIIVNAEKVKVTGKKMEQKPAAVVEHAVRGMLPSGKLGDQMYTKLHVYVGPDHDHAAQKPEVLDI